jgi:glycine cleavage system transcriptional repressor
MTKRRPSAAFTMVELMVAVLVAIIVTVGIYELYTTYVKAFVAQDRVLETQQAARIAIDTMTQDLLRAGYKVPSGQPAVTFASANAVEVQLFNETVGLQERIRYTLDLQNRLVREVFHDTGTYTLVPAVSGVLVENVLPSETQPAVLFQYYRVGGAGGFSSLAASTQAVTPVAVGTPLSVANAGDVATLNDIRQVQVTLTVRSSQEDPVRGDFVFRTLRADVKPRNAGLMSTTLDSTPPAVPTGLASVDRGDCGTLYLSWNDNTEPDIAGYTLTWGYADGAWTDSINIGKGISHSVSVPYAVSGLTDGTDYWFTISAFDHSGNSSANAPSLNGTAGTADTMPNIANPDNPPVIVSATGGNGYIDVAFNAVAEPDIIGYRVYAKPTAFSDADLSTLSTSNGASLPASTRVVAGEGQFSPPDPARVTGTTTGFSVRDDNSTLLQGCTDVHYAVTAIGADRPGIVAALTGALRDLGGNLEDVSSTILRGHFAMMLVVDVPGDPDRVRAALDEAAGPLGVQVHVADVETGAPERPRATHTLTAYGADRPGIVAALTTLLAERRVNVTDLSSRRTSGPAPIYGMLAAVAVPPGLAVRALAAGIGVALAELGVDVSFHPVEVETL